MASDTGGPKARPLLCSEQKRRLHEVAMSCQHFFCSAVKKFILPLSTTFKEHEPWKATPTPSEMRHPLYDLSPKPVKQNFIHRNGIFFRRAESRQPLPPTLQALCQKPCSVQEAPGVSATPAF
jgi:hypothetical protein